MATAEARKAVNQRAIRTEGGLFGPDFLERLAEGELEGQHPGAFGVKGSLQETIAEAYEAARLYWTTFQKRLEKLPSSESEVSVTREGFVIPFLSLLGYQLTFQREWPEAAGRKWPISHRANPDLEAPPVLVVGYSSPLGRAEPSLGNRSPHGLMQDYLNVSGHLWGLVTNGRSLRLLRQTPFLRRQAYLEVDLEAILDGDGQAEFALLYRLLHISRLPKNRAEAGESWLERYFQLAIAQGERARERLRDGVEGFLQELGTGLLRNSDHTRVEEARKDPQGFYGNLLRFTYRILFLLVAEARGSLGGNQVYREGYSLSRLAQLVDDPEAHTEDHDLWLHLRTLFHLLRDPTPVGEEGKPLASFLGLAVLNGHLFDTLPLDEEGFRIQNRHLLEALRHLLYYYDEEHRTWRRVNYAALDVEELGSVYESLLENHPLITRDGGEWRFRFVQGSERKSTGSYYTPDSLVDLVLKQALDPLIEERLEAAGPDREAREKALLSLKVVDPAAGSGHFLLGAARRIGRRLAQVRTGEEEPPPEAYRQAVRDVVTHCLYGVDRNALAVELCRVALWLESHVPGKPLTFLDHRIRHGDSLLGITDLEVLEKGIPDGAFSLRKGKRHEALSQLRRQNRREREMGAADLFAFVDAMGLDSLEEKVRGLEAVGDESVDEIRRKEREYEAFRKDPELLKLLEAADLWTAAFFQPIPPEDPRAAITTAVLNARLLGSRPEQPLRLAKELAKKHVFFHWPLEFPEVFAQGGFDLVLGNPPWERIKVQEQEFFASRDSRIAEARNAAERKRLIAELPKTNPALWAEYQEALVAAEGQSLFLRESGLYPLTGRGDINTYSVFAERMRALLKPGGRMGIIVPTGIATDETNKLFFAQVVERGELVSLYDFENRKGLFPAVHRSYKFCLFTLRKGDGRPSSARAEFAFFLHEAADLQDPERRFTLAPEDFQLLNPNTRTAPIFRNRRDAELTKHIYRRVPVLVAEAKGEGGNPWGVEFLRMLDMANDSHLFRTREELEGEGCVLQGKVFLRGKERYLPLYEAKMVHQFDHRFGDYAMQREGSESTQLPEDPLERLADPHYQVLPRYWVPEEEVEARLAAKGWDRGWLLGWRAITNVTNERTVIAAVIPRVGVGHSLPIFLVRVLEHAPCLLGCLASFSLDFAARQKVGGTNLTYNYLEQFPVLPPSAFEKPLPFLWEPEPSPLPPRSWPPTVADFVRPRVLELTYTAWDLKPFAEDLGYDGPPFRYDPERRFRLRAELDALFFLLYLGTPEEWEREASPELKALFPTPREAVAYILDQFPIVKRREEERYGEYRTKRTILEIYEAFLERLPRAPVGG